MINTMRSGGLGKTKGLKYEKIQTIGRDIKELLEEGRVFRDFIISIMSIYGGLVGGYLTASNKDKYDIGSILQELSTRREIEIVFVFSITVAILTNIDHIRSQFIEDEQAIMIIKKREKSLIEGESTLQERIRNLQETKSYLTQIDTGLIKDINIKGMDIRQFKEETKKLHQKIALHLETVIANFDNSEEKRYIQATIDANYYQD